MIHSTQMVTRPPQLIVSPGTYSRITPSPPRECLRPVPIMAMDRIVQHQPIVNRQIDWERSKQIEKEMREEKAQLEQVRHRREKVLKDERSKLDNLISERLKEQIKEIEREKEERDQKILRDDQEARESLSTKRLELQKTLSKKENPKSVTGSERETPSLKEDLPRIIFIHKTTESLINMPLPTSLSRVLQLASGERDSIIRERPKLMSENIPKPVSFDLGGGFQSNACGPINTTIRKRILMGPSMPARCLENSKVKIKMVEKPSPNSVVDGGVQEAVHDFDAIEINYSQRASKILPERPRGTETSHTYSKIERSPMNEQPTVSGMKPAMKFPRDRFTSDDSEANYPRIITEASRVMNVYRDQADGFEGSAPFSSKFEINKKITDDDPGYYHPKISHPFIRRSSPNIERFTSNTSNTTFQNEMTYQPTQRPSDLLWNSPEKYKQNLRQASCGKFDLSPKEQRTGDQKRFDDWMYNTAGFNEISWPRYKQLREDHMKNMDEEEERREETFPIYRNKNSFCLSSSKQEERTWQNKQNSQSKGYSFGKDRTNRIPQAEVNCGLRMKKLPTYETRCLKELADRRKLDVWRKQTTKDYEKIGKLIGKAEFHDAQIYQAKVEENEALRRAQETEDQKLDRIAWEYSGSNLFSGLDTKGIVYQYGGLASKGYCPNSSSQPYLGNRTQTRNNQHEMDGFDESYGLFQTNGGKVYTFFCEKYGMSK